MPAIGGIQAGFSGTLTSDLDTDGFEIIAGSSPVADTIIFTADDESSRGKIQASTLNATTTGGAIRQQYSGSVNRVELGSGQLVTWSDLSNVGGTRDVGISRDATLGLDLNNATAGGGAYLRMNEMTAPSGTTNAARLYALANGNAQTDLKAIFQSGTIGSTFAQEGVQMRFLWETVAVGDFTDNGDATGTITLTEQLPAGSVVIQSLCTNIVGFGGDTTATAVIGTSADPDRYINVASFNVFATAATGKGLGVGPSGSAWHSAAQSVEITVTGSSDFGLIVTDANGAMTVGIMYVVAT